jgi:glycine hydroxymethyltransferase
MPLVDRLVNSNGVEGISAIPLVYADIDVAGAIEAELRRQRHSIELIASENFVSRAVLDAQGSVLTNKYAEGYPNRRYYGGCVNVDVIETLAIERAKLLFGSSYANVQAHSGSQANQAVFLALLSPGDKIMGLDLKAGGHLTHGATVNISGRWFNSISYGVHPQHHWIDMRAVEALALQHRPKLIVAGGSAYSRIIDFAAFRRIADSIDAFLMVDMAHFAGLVAGGVYPSPIPHAHVVTSTTHKTLRGPRGGLILTNDADIGKKIQSAIFPGLQGGPLMHVIAAKAVAFEEALQPSFRIYADAVVRNARALSDRLAKGGLPIVSGGTDSHLVVVDLRPLKITGSTAEKALESVGITLNKNTIPDDPEKPTVTSGIRVGSAAGTSRGFREPEFCEIGDLVLDALQNLQRGPSSSGDRFAKAIKERAARLAARFPLPY